MKLSSHDHAPLQEIFGFLGEMIDSFDRDAKRYATEVWLADQSKLGTPQRPRDMHPLVAEAIRDVVRDVAVMTRMPRKAAA